MRVPRSTFILIAVACLLVIRAASAHAPSVRAGVAPLSAAGQASPADAAAFSDLRVKWADGMRTKNADAVAALYAPDAVFLSTEAGRIVGRTAIHDLCKDMMASFTSNLTFHSLATDRSGDLAYDSGEYTEAMLRDADGAMSQGHGNYLMVYKHYPEGWLIVEQVWTGSEPSH
jgi:uncharacterized protein (TIGR02246 family)